MNCLFRWFRNKDSEVYGLLVGFLVGWLMLWYKSLIIVLYIVYKLVEVRIIKYM